MSKNLIIRLLDSENGKCENVKIKMYFGLPLFLCTDYYRLDYIETIFCYIVNCSFSHFLTPYLLLAIFMPFDSCKMNINRQFYDKEGYMRSFDPEIVIEMKEALNFYNTFGFVVLSNIFNNKECEATKNAMWKIVEKDCPLLKGSDSSTWKEYTSSGKYGLSMKGPCFHPNLLRNRCKSKLLKAVSKLINLDQYQDNSNTNDDDDDDDDRVMVGHDRFTIYRPTLMDSSFTTGAANIHLDMNPWCSY